MTEPIHVNVPGGIGDISWTHSKLVPLGKPIHYHIARRVPDSSVPYCEILDGVVGADVGSFSYKQIKGRTPDPTQPLPESFDTMCLNDFLGEGNRLERAYPGTETCFHYDFNLSPIHEASADAIATPFEELDPKTRFFGIYTSSVTMTSSWKGWKCPTWVEFIKLFRSTYGSHWVPMIIGADFDRGITDPLIQALIRERIPVAPVVGHHIGTVVDLLQEKIKFLTGFNSGICVLSNVCYVPCLMQFPSFLVKLRYSWPDTNMHYRAIDFTTPEDAMYEVRVHFHDILENA
jgi:hypothetical protein